VARWVNSTVRSALVTRGMSTAAGTGSGGKSGRPSPGSKSPGISQSSRACCGVVPARRARRVLAPSRCAVAPAGAAALPAASVAGAAPGASASSTASSLDAPGGELLRVEQLLELRGRQIGHLRGHLADRASLGIGLLGNGSTFLIADNRIERS